MGKVLYEGLNELNVNLVPIYVPPPVAHLSGRVTDAQTGWAIGEVKITLGGQVKYTDAEGVYAFLDLTPGTYTIKFEKSGYETLTM